MRSLSVPQAANAYLALFLRLALGVTVAETCLGFALIIGLFTQQSALASGVLLFLFALGMTVGTGVKSALNASVFSASAAAFALSNWRVSVWSIDALRLRRGHERNG